MDSSFESFGETESSAASSVCPTGEVGDATGLPSDEFSSRVPCGTGAEVARLQLLVEAYERTLAKRTNQLSKMMDDLEFEDHKLVLTGNWSCEIVELLTWRCT